MTSKKKHILILLLLTIFSIFLSGSIDYKNSSYSNMDMNKYISMAEASPGIETNIIRPFVYRIAVPWLAGLLPFSIAVSFLILNSVSLFLLSIVFYLFLLEYKTDEKLALVITIIFQFNRYFFQFLGWNYFQVSDTLSLTLLFYSFILLRHRSFVQLFFVMVFGVLVKEYILIFIPAGFALLFERKLIKKELLSFSVVSFVSVLTFWGIRKLIPTEAGESLFIQYTTQLIYYSEPILLIKRFIIPSLPFGLLPLLFYKDLFYFFEKNKHLFIYSLTVVILSFFGESERLMAPLAPIYFLFIAELITKYFITEPEKTFKNNLIISLIIIAFLTSFYHLWGVLKLPNEYYSMISTFVFTIAVTLVFLSKRIANNSAMRD
ncbi:MAG: hypothetical protein L3J41_02060 [Melioribacteraceae bacterium]|nr:hypothetical protein [Melioribacteraceae bacterium]